MEIDAKKESYLQEYRQNKISEAELNIKLNELEGL